MKAMKVDSRTGCAGSLLALCLCLLLTACAPAGGGEDDTAGSVSGGGAVSPAELTSPPAGGSDVEPIVCLTCRIIDGAEDGSLLLAALSAPLAEGCGSARDSLHDGRSVYRLALAEDTPVYLDGAAADASVLEDGMPLEITFNGTVLETFPAQLGEVYGVYGHSIGTAQNPGGGLYDLCGLYLQALDDLWHKDPALNENITIAGLDLSQAPGDLLESEAAALAWRFGELHGVEVVTGTFETLRDQGYFAASEISAPAPKEGDEPRPKLYEWPDGCLFSIRPNGNHTEEMYSLPTIFFDVEKWKSPLAAYVLYDCCAVWPAAGTWSGYQVGSEMIS